MSEGHKSECPAGTGHIADKTTDTQIFSGLEIPGKREATLLAQFALAGHSVHRLADGGFLVCRHGYVKHCPDLPALAGFARQTGVRS
jgi:hypothetical protein